MDIKTLFKIMSFLKEFKDYEIEYDISPDEITIKMTR